MLKIAYIVEPHKVIGGGVRAAINLVKAMKSYYGEDAIIFGVYRGSVKDNEVQFEEVNTLQPIGIRYWRRLHNFLRDYKPDVVHCLGLYTALTLITYRMLFHKSFKIVCTVHRVTMNMRFGSIIRMVLPFIVRHLDYTTFLTNYQRNHYFQNVGFAPKKNIVVPNVIYVEQCSQEEIEAKREELLRTVDAEHLTCYVGRIIPSKNIEDTIRLIGKLNRRGLNIGVVLVGGYTDDYYQKLQQVIQEEDVKKKVAFVGYVNNPTLYISACTTTTTTTHGEALPNLMVESFALGKVVFSSDIPQMVDLIKNGEYGFTHSLKDLDGFADVMYSIYSDTELRKKIETNARNTYLSNYEPRLVAKKYHEVYENA